MKRRLLTAVLVCLAALQATAIPNFGSWTDGYVVYDVRGSLHSRLSFSTYDKDADGKLRYFSLTAVPGGYVVDSLDSDYCVLPPMMQPGDTVWWNEAGLFMFDKQGRPYASLKECRSYYNSPKELLRCDSLSILQGEYQFAGTRYMNFYTDEANTPMLVADEGMAPEPVAFLPDVMYNGKPLMHIQTPKRRWLVEATPTGLNVYSAVWSKTKQQYQRGTLQRKAKLMRPRSMYYQEHWNSFPFVDLLVRYYPKTVFQQLYREMEPLREERPFVLYMSIIERLKD